jgi:hypothetical protein
MRLMGLYYLRNCYIGGELSRGIVATGATMGMRRRVAIGCALMKSPHVLIMDQPTRGLSAFDQSEIMEVLKRLSNQVRSRSRTLSLARSPSPRHTEGYRNTGVGGVRRLVMILSRPAPIVRFAPHH